MTNWKKIEAVLFSSGKYLTEDKLMSILKIDKRALNRALKDLKAHYDNADTSLKLFNEESSWKLNVKEEYSDVVREIVSDLELPKPVMETLAFIAYRSPVIQSDVIEVRGVTAYDHIGFLEDKKFITREKHGRSYKVKIAERFHDYFDVEDAALQSMFKDISPPESVKLGTLDVYDTKTDDDTFETSLGERMKKPEPIKKNEEEEFLKDIDSKIESVKERIDQHDADEISITKKEDDSDIFASDKESEEPVEDTDDTDNDEDKDLFAPDKESEENDDTPENVVKKVNKQIDALFED